MALVKNTTRGPLGLSPDSIIGAGQTAEVDDKTLERVKTTVVGKYMFDEGMLKEVAAEKPKEPKTEKPPTKDKPTLTLDKK